METIINRNLLQFAVQTAISCPRCHHILDMRSAVNATLTMPGKTREYIMCAACYDTVRLQLNDLAMGLEGEVTVLDGRVLFPGRPQKTRKAPGVPLTPEERHARIVAALTDYDRKSQAKAASDSRRYHNPHALAMYFDALQRAEHRMEKGVQPVVALSEVFTRPLLAIVLKAAGVK